MPTHRDDADPSGDDELNFEPSQSGGEPPEAFDSLLVLALLCVAAVVVLAVVYVGMTGSVPAALGGRLPDEASASTGAAQTQLRAGLRHPSSNRHRPSSSGPRSRLVRTTGFAPCTSE